MIPHTVLDALVDRVVAAVHPQRIILFGDHPGMVYRKALADGREIYHAA